MFKRCSAFGLSTILVLSSLLTATRSEKPALALEVIQRGITVTVPAGEGALTLYEDVNLLGRSLTLVRDSDFLGHQGFNDRASSLQVHSGQWQLCPDAYYGGLCRQVGPGVYPNIASLGIPNDTLSSVRLISGGSGGSVLPPSGGGIQPLPQPIGSLMLYENANYQGRSLSASDSLRNLSNQGFNDLTTSLQINSGVWDLCEDVNFRGYCRRLGPGSYPDVRLVGINNDTISSVRLVSVDGSGGSGGSILQPPSVVYPPSLPYVPPPRDNYGRDSSGCLDGYYRQGAYCVRY